MAIAESKENPRAESPAGAVGIMQLMPATGREMAGRLGVDYRPLNPRANIMLGTAYLAQVEGKFADHPDPLKIKLSLAGYHAGPYRVAKVLEAVLASGAGDVWSCVAAALPAATVAYVADVLKIHEKLGRG